MSGPFGSSQWMYNPGGAFYDYEIDNSLRFNDNDSARLERTPSSNGNRKTWTFSAWVKIGDTEVWKTLLGSGNSYFNIYDAGNGYTLALTLEAQTNGFVRTNAVFRDPSAWYHIVLRCDTTQGTASDRIRFYVNGEQQTSLLTANYPSQNLDTDFNSTQTQGIGKKFDGAANLWDGYMAEVIMVDGQSLDATSFGETKSGVWIPKEYSGSYGTNGFHLEFAGNANDTSGNGNNFTSYNISSYDYMSDSPTNNFPTLSPIDKSSGPTLYDGNLRYSYNSRPASKTVRATMALPSSGKFYWELENEQSTPGRIQFGLVKFESASSSYDSNMYTDANYVSYQYSGGLYFEGTSLGNVGVTYYAGERGAIAVDCDTGKVWFGKVSSGGTTTWWDSSAGSTGDPASGANPVGTLTDPTQWMPVVGWHEGGFGSEFFAANINFGQKDFLGTPPANFETLSSANLPDPAIDPANDDTPADYFNTVLYTGANPNAAQSVTGVGFQPDFLWIKSRVTGYGHALQDVVRGATGRLQSDTTGSESVSSTYVSSFDSDGFSLGVDYGQNAPSEPYAAWNWKAGGTGVSNTDGSITSTVSANTDAGFSVVGYTGNGTNTSTVGHGLSSAPEFVIVKSRSNSRNWVVEHNQGKGMYLNLTNDGASAGSNTMTQQASTIRFDVSNDGNRSVNFNSETYVAYCFHSVDGFSKIGSYIGNGSSDGSFIYTGFRPAWVVVKRYDSSNNWNSHDNKRGPYNVNDWRLYLNLSSAEDSGGSYGVDFLSNGFKVRTSEAGWNASGGTYIYLAFAEQPFKYANAR